MTAQEIINQWNSMTGEAQFKFCENCVKRAISLTYRVHGEKGRQHG